MKDNHINIFYSDEDKGNIADFPNLKYCSAFGENPEEALSEVIKSKEAWIESARKNNISISEAKFKPAIYQAAS